MLIVACDMLDTELGAEVKKNSLWFQAVHQLPSHTTFTVSLNQYGRESARMWWIK